MTKTTGFGLLTCWSRPIHSMDLYQVPFSPVLWCWFVFFVLLLVALKTICVDLHLLENCYQLINTLINNSLFVLAPIVEDCVLIPSKIEKSSAYKLVLGLWLLQSILINQLYNSSLSSSLIAPPESETVTSFHDLLSNDEKLIKGKNSHILFELLRQIYLHPKLNEKIKIIVGNKNIRDSSFLHYLTNPIREICYRQKYFECSKYINLLPNMEMTEFYGYFDSEKNENKTFRLLLSENSKRLLFLHSRLEGYTEEDRNKSKIKNFSKADLKIEQNIFPSLIEEKLVRCGKHVLIEEEDYLKREYNYLVKNYYWIKFVKSKDTINTEYYFWKFSDTENSNVHLYFKYFMESGAFNHLSDLIIKNEFHKGRIQLTKIIVKNKAKPLLEESVSLNKRIDTFFLIWGIFIAIALIEFITEICKWKYYTLVVIECFMLFKIAIFQGFKFCYDQFIMCLKKF